MITVGDVMNMRAFDSIWLAAPCEGAAEQSLPDDTGTGEFTNYNEWCQYNDTDPYQANHVVTIVGWDDDYPASNFSGQAGAPDGNGAWLVKNS